MGEPTEEQMRGYLVGTATAKYDKDRADEIAATGSYKATYEKLRTGYYGPVKKSIITGKLK